MMSASAPASITPEMLDPVWRLRMSLPPAVAMLPAMVPRLVTVSAKLPTMTIASPLSPWIVPSL